ncbi:alcohol dehydrogenase [Schizosaccharomyces cryophilus OY26]|uniref:Alcohol dehydrogenase n=1 Tax=Schizosaccharomyces cryophilus (strain OY26 / ATCC MYA-4695 / CBS 11777 / NBRC 106824 / NRRL Y48691) TaxID=653667 RepID=S9W3K1_SCHCR|nr:alcohol dehydrogenase [Schizosaccharomyces cryophilus OY26]EPY53124.1 alcohol dehydrogenase [Schizosaccharomyces cryophilus OY26]
MPLQYVVNDTKSGFDQLKIQDSKEVASLKPNEVKVNLKAASLNFRDLIITKGMYPLPLELPVVPGSDGVGVIEKVGDDVDGFKPGDTVICNFFTDYIDGKPTKHAITGALGGTYDGAFRQVGVFPAHALVHAPKNLNYEEASTLPCAALTAWNALFGSQENQLKPGQNVLIQGTGGVSIFALQFAVATGARATVISSSDEKLQFAKKLGASHLINYKTNPEWAKPALEATNNVGYHHVVEVGGEKTLGQSLEVLALSGAITSIGFVAQQGTSPNLTSLIGQMLNKNATIRGIFVGPVNMFKDMIACIEANDIHPVVDKVFPFEQLKEAYNYQWSQQHVARQRR